MTQPSQMRIQLSHQDDDSTDLPLAYTRREVRKVLILGATSGIAMATARLLAAEGASLYLAARNPERLSVIAADLRLRGAQYVAESVTNLDTTAQHPALIADAIKQLGGLDLVLLAHGVLGDQKEAEDRYAVAAAILQTNLLSAVSLLTLLSNYFVQQRSGTLAVITSVAGDRGRKSNYLYGTSKGALNIFLDGLRNRIDREGVQVLTIRPGFVATAMTAHLPQGPLFASPQTIAEGILSAIKKRKDIVYLPWFWSPIMQIIQAIPESIFKKLNL
jgi:decaprenylphospho-beta-D-erythro-pentofuranosid-2-ulose 2-reductase